MNISIPHKKSRIKRQSLHNRIAHWLTAFSTLTLIFTGFGQMPMYQRYGLTSVPGFAWAGEYAVTLAAHYIAGAVLIFAIVYHITYMVARREFDILPRRGDFKESVEVIVAMVKRCKGPACHKYLGEQRLAYAFIGGNLLLATMTGIIKVVKNLPGVDLSAGAMLAAATLHNLAAVMLVLGIAGHLVAFAFKENRALLSSMFSGCVDLDYVKERHAHWYNDLVAEPHVLRRSMCAVKKRFGGKEKRAS